MPTKLLVVIPTRNRSALAATAVRSVLDQAHPHVSLWVSDNSTEPLEIERLRQFCATAGAAVRYLRPAEPLAMGKHWEWVLRQALEADQFSHCCVLTDRMAFLPGAVEILTGLCNKLQQAVISYPGNIIEDDKSPITLVQHLWTGRVLRIESSYFARYLLYKGWVDELPRLLNCVAPVAALRHALERYGTICESISPDIAFGFRQLTLSKDFYRLDRPLLVEHSLQQSNGRSLLQSDQPNADARDFLARLDDRGLNYAAPIPGLPTIYSAIFHEYNLVRSTQPDSLPKINLMSYIRLEMKRIRKSEDESYKTLVTNAINGFVSREWHNFAYAAARAFSWWITSRLQPKLVLNRIKIKLFTVWYFQRERVFHGPFGKHSHVRTRDSRGRATACDNLEAALTAAFFKPVPHRQGPATIEGRMPTTLRFEATSYE